MPAGYPGCVPDDPNVLFERREARPQSIAQLRHVVTRFAAAAGAPSRQLEDIALAVSEALTNAVVHAYPDVRRPGQMAVHASAHDRVLEILVSDEGVGMAAEAPMATGGLGYTLMAHVSDELAVRGSPGWGVRTHLTFELD